MSAALPWIVGVLLVIAVGGFAAWAGRHRSPTPVTVDRARSLLSELELAVDQAAGTVPTDTLAEARRLQLLAGGCLAGRPDAADARRSAEYSRRALRLLG